MQTNGSDGQGEMGGGGRKASVRRSVLGGAAILAVAGAGGWWWHYHQVGQFLQTTDDAFFEADIVTVSPKVSGFVKQVLVAQNEDVMADQPLVILESREYAAEKARALGQVAVSKAVAAGVDANLIEQESAIAQARSQLDAARGDLVFAEQQVARYRPLAATGAETAERLAQMENNRTTAAAKVAAQKSALAAQQQRLASLRAQLTQAQAQGDVGNAEVEKAGVNLDSARLAARTNGRIADLSVRVGQYVQAGTRLMSIVPVQDLYVEANFKETQIGRMTPGQPAEIEVDALPGVNIRGTVSSISPGTGAQFSLLPPQNATGNYTKVVQRVPVRIKISADPEVHKLLVAGLSVTVTVDTRATQAGATAGLAKQGAEHG